jgi:hypothetical protein
LNEPSPPETLLKRIAIDAVDNGPGTLDGEEGRRVEGRVCCTNR